MDLLVGVAYKLQTIGLEVEDLAEVGSLFSMLEPYLIAAQLLQLVVLVELVLPLMVEPGEQDL
jgi:hypothetical protein